MICPTCRKPMLSEWPHRHAAVDLLDPDPLHVDEDQDHRVSRWDHHSRPPRPDGVPGPALVLAIVGIPLLVLIIAAAWWLAVDG